MLDTANFCQSNAGILSPQIASHSGLFEIRGNFYTGIVSSLVSRRSSIKSNLSGLLHMSLLYFFKASCYGIRDCMSLFYFLPSCILLFPSAFLILARNLSPSASDTPNSTPTTYYILLLSCRPLSLFELETK